MGSIEVKAEAMLAKASMESVDLIMQSGIKLLTADRLKQVIFELIL